MRQLEQFTHEVMELGLRYEYERGPAQVHSLEDAQRGGLNCVALVHLWIALQGVVLSPSLQCTELYFDQSLTKVERSQARPGDLAWLGRQSNTNPRTFMPVYSAGRLLNWHEFPINHVGIIVSDPQQHLRVMHVSQTAGTVVVSSLAELAKTPRYAVLHEVTRLKP
jgi:cell wall-associated NlpC family hydrolase